METVASPEKSRLRDERGQSLVLAIIVMFLLIAVGAVFVLLVARNQARAGGAKDRLIAQYLAEAGVQYADKMLRTSELGADWRPKPDNLPPAMKDHPDFKWLRPWATADAPDGSTGPTGGFTSFGMGEGRFLLRVSYNPNPNDPMSKYIKIECVGRIGVVETDDPTTWESNIRLRRELTAYKPIGVTDNLRFITNKEKRSADIALGAPGFYVEFGSESDGRGAPIRVNGNLVWYGKRVDIVLRGITYNGSGGPSLLPIDTVAVSGTISHQSLQEEDPEVQPGQRIPVEIHELINDGTNVTPYPYFVFPSSGDAPFTTRYGFYRDGSEYADADKHARNVKRIEPPLLDSTNTPNKVPRYVTLTRDYWYKDSDTGRMVNSGRYGWGRGVYIDNRDDRQPDSETLFGGYTPVRDWMKPNNGLKDTWQGPYYVPPGVVITLNPYDTDGDNEPDITITRTDIKLRRGDPDYGRKAVWRDPTGSPMVKVGAGGDAMEVGATLTIPYPQGHQTLDYWKYLQSPYGHSAYVKRSITLDRNGVIYAEGNIRIRGMMAPGKQVTVVSGGTIYIEGNLLKYRDSAGTVDNTCAIALLAKEYVCVNTTQFVSLLTSVGPGSFGSDSGTGKAPYHLIVTPEPATTFVSSFAFGPRTGDMSITPMLLTRHAGAYGASYINMWLNGQLLPLWGGGPLPDFVYGVGDYRYWQVWNQGAGINPGLFEHKVWGMNALPPGLLNTAVGIPNVFEVALDQSSYTRSNYLLSTFTVQPLDIRIEAIIYAQEGSFFVIPGNWFNMNATDVGGSGNRPGTDPMWPLFGQALDIKITIDGAITENMPASVSDVAEWYSKWSSIPETYGSSGQPTAHQGDGLTFTYDPFVGWPVDPASNAPIRMDAYDRPLPAAPCLPVCESLIYYGEPM